MKKILLLALLFPLVAGATSVLNWTPSLANTDGTTFTASAITAYTVYRGAKTDGSDLAKLTTIAPTSSTYTDSTATYPGTWCYAISETTQIESAKTSLVCKTVTQPGAPTTVTITISIP